MNPLDPSNPPNPCPHPPNPYFKYSQEESHTRSNWQYSKHTLVLPYYYKITDCRFVRLFANAFCIKVFDLYNSTTVQMKHLRKFSLSFICFPKSFMWLNRVKVNLCKGYFDLSWMFLTRFSRLPILIFYKL